jgi:predicted ATPase
MQKLSIKNFGPISELNININKVMVFIGPQASGKSTVSKSIYLFKSLKDDLVKHLIEALEQEDDAFSTQKATTEFKKMIRTKFVSFWGTTRHLTSLSIEYDYGNNKVIVLKVKSGYIEAAFSEKLREELNTIFSATSQFIRKQKKINKSLVSASEQFAIDSEKITSTKGLKN